MYNPQFTFRGPIMLRIVSAIFIVISANFVLSAQDKPKITLDEFFNSVSFPAIAISPDGTSVVIVSERADWNQERSLAVS